MDTKMNKISERQGASIARAACRSQLGCEEARISANVASGGGSPVGLPPKLGFVRSGGRGRPSASMVTTLAVRRSHWETDKNAPRTAGWNGASRDCGSGSVARATPFDFTYTGNLVDFTAPATGLYQILAFGAQGEASTSNSSAPAVAVPKLAVTSS